MEAEEKGFAKAKVRGGIRLQSAMLIALPNANCRKTRCGNGTTVEGSCMKVVGYQWCVCEKQMVYCFGGV